MLITTNAIVVSKLKYKESDLIIKCYTQELGIVSFLLKGVLKGSKKNAKIAYFQLLSQLQLSFFYRQNRSLQTIKEVKLNVIYSTLYSNILKSSIVMFLSEVLSSILKEEEKNETLFSYIETAFLWLDAHSECSNFHLLFLLNLTKYLGFYPDTTSNYDFFNLNEGKFEFKKVNQYTLSGENVTLLKSLLNTTFDRVSELKLNTRQRQMFLGTILKYFEIHLGNFKQPKSLFVFNQVFN